MAFDDLRCDGRTYRFGSVGEDNKLILVRMNRVFVGLRLSLPDAVGFLEWSTSSSKVAGNHYDRLAFDHSDEPLQATHHQRVSMGSMTSLAFRRDRSALHLPSADENPSPRYHPAPSRNEIAVVQPVLVSY